MVLDVVLTTVILLITQSQNSATFLLLSKHHCSLWKNSIFIAYNKSIRVAISPPQDTGIAHGYTKSCGSILGLVQI